MIGYILESLESFGEGLAEVLFALFVVLPVLFVGFFTSAVLAAQAAGYYFIIKNKTYLRRGWGFAYADIVDEDDRFMLYWSVDGRYYKSGFHGFSYEDTIPILYKTKKPKRFILCDEKYWRSKMHGRCIATLLWGIFFLPLFIKFFC